MKVQTLPNSNLPKTLGTPPGKDPQPQGPKDQYAAYNEVETDQHRTTYETAFNLARGASFVVEGAARIGQTMQLGSSLFGGQAGSLAPAFGLVGGTIDVARGASMAQQSSINRNRTGTVLGGLQVAQGMATWVCAGAALAGGPVLVSQLAAVAAVGAYAGRLGVQAHAKHEASKPTKAGAPLPTQPVSVKFDEKAQPKGDGRLLENTFALAKAVSEAASNTGGMAAGWNNVSGAFSGSAPTGIWQGLGIIGSTYTVLQSAAQVAHSAGNQNFDGTVAGTIGLIQGAASMATSMGVGGHLAPGIAIGAYVLKQAVPLLQLKKKLTGDKQDGDENGMWNRLKENVGHAFSGKPADAPPPPPNAGDKKQTKAVEEPKESKPNTPPEPKS